MATQPAKKTDAKVLAKRDMKKTKGGIIAVKPADLKSSPNPGSIDPCIRNRAGGFIPCV